ncbi:MAG TPA: transglycosylase domain-containing protein [Actinomycetota bacterium]|nr:transglycosylase domain-containing protein [Actinomycetota bacterium]
MATKTSQPRARRGPKHAPRTPRRKPERRSFLRRYWWALLGVPAVVGLLALLALVVVYLRLDLPRTPPPIQTTYVYDRHGQLITTIHASVDRTLIPLSDMPRHLREAVIATEDDGFYSHPGFDPLGILRAAWVDIVRREAVQGGSTITQQLVKNVYAGSYVEDPVYGRVYRIPDRTIGQKVREVLLAVKVEQTFTKDQILANYLNTVYFGHGAYGAEAAARTYFGKDAEDLTLLQSATLAGLIAAPGRFDPYVDPGAARERRNHVLDLMVEEGYLDAARAARLKVEPVRTAGEVRAVEAPGASDYFVDYVRRILIRQLGEPQVYGGGLRVTTTLDMQWQRIAERVVRDHLDAKGDPAAALVAVDPRTGAIRAMVGGRNFHRSQVNLAVAGMPGFAGTGRQAGSAFKTFTLVAALEHRYSLDSVWSGPPTITIDDRRCYTGGRPWEVGNADPTEGGTFTLASATAHSVNTVFAQLVAEVGPEAVVDVAHRMGIRSPLQPVCSITLGSQSVAPLEMANAYATLAARGVHRRATGIEEVVDAEGDVVRRIRPRGTRAIAPNDAALATYALRGVITSGTGTAAAIGRPAAGKTGTTQNYADAWFCGYVPQLATCVWVGYPQGQEPLLNVQGFARVYGGTIPAMIWHDFMAEVTAGMPVRDFPQPSFAGYTEGPRPTPPPAPSPEPTPPPSPEPTESPTPKPTKTPPVPTGTPSPPVPEPTEGPARRR